MQEKKRISPFMWFMALLSLSVSCSEDPPGLGREELRSRKTPKPLESPPESLEDAAPISASKDADIGAAKPSDVGDASESSFPVEAKVPEVPKTPKIAKVVTYARHIRPLLETYQCLS